MKQALYWAPTVLMGVGALLTVGIDTQRSMPIEQPLDSVIPIEIAGFIGEDITISEAEVSVAAPTNYLMRSYELHGDTGVTTPWFSLYVGYYARQMRGRTIHSPKNCLPGSGWEALASEPMQLQVGDGTATVNRYLLQNGSERALVLYWYQGRGRVEHNEYVVKWDLLRDSALRRRSEEALVRIVVPITTSEDQSIEVARHAAAVVAPLVYRALPRW